ncbi:hypothetical protein T484DRAFT_1811273 [Baffinella frigidus]|nr:hypothetical protein T484DRAFT_1811273 [Cryptophyta sp. CCMP2293]
MLSQLVKSAAHKEETDSPSSHGKAKQRGALMPADALRAIAGQRAGMPEPEEKVADWDRIYWARMAKASPTLHICKALDKSVLELLDHLAALSAWRSDAHLTTLSVICSQLHFTTLSVICSQLCRAKADLGGNATKVVAQVRALLIESQRDEDLVVSRELQKRRNDPSMHLEEQIEKLTTQLQTTKTDFLTTRTARRWERLVLILEIRFLETRGNKLKKSEEKYITRIKASTTLKGLLAGAQEETAVKPPPCFTALTTRKGLLAGAQEETAVKLIVSDAFAKQ